VGETANIEERKKNRKKILEKIEGDGIQSTSIRLTFDRIQEYLFHCIRRENRRHAYSYR
jgi:hypothetical protein